MDFMHLLFSFKGRIRRLHYWLAAVGVSLAFTVVLSALLFAVLLPASNLAPGEGPGAALWIGIALMVALCVPMVWIGWALQAKRWHDRDKSAVWILINFIPFGSIWALIECGFLDGTPGPNRFGPSPKYGDQTVGYGGRYGGYGGQAGATVVS